MGGRMSVQKHFIKLVFSVLLLFRTLSSQIIFQGTVNDNGGEYLGNGSEPVFNALVTLTDQTDSTRCFSAYTDEQGRFSVEIITTGISEAHPASPGGFRLYQNYPNPFNPSTVIRYELGRPCRVRIWVYNVSGQKVRTLIDGVQNGPGQVTWDATDDRGMGVPAGLYICSLQAEGSRINRKMLLIDGHTGPAETESSVSHAVLQNSNPVFRKSGSVLYQLEVTGENMTLYTQPNLEITEDMTVDVTVKRTVTDIDGNVYQTVRIGSQWWTAENLKVGHYRNGDPIPCMTDEWEWEHTSTGAYCAYDNDESNAGTFGYLYNWYAVKDRRGLAPEGWHVPTDAEWRELEMFLGISQPDANRFGTRGTDEGGKLKATGTSLWEDPNEGASNESGFEGLPNGCRDFWSGFDNLNLSAYLWSATESTDGGGISRYMTYLSSHFGRSASYTTAGYAVRLVRDSGSEPWLDRIEISQMRETFSIRDSVAFTCTAVFSDDSRKDVTLETGWSVSPGTAGKISSTGLFTTFDSSGIETVTARYQDKEVSCTVMIQDTTHGTPGDFDEITGTWQAVTETADLSAYSMGEITVTPYSDLFLNIVMVMKADSTFEYETWTGPDKYSSGADYDAGSGTWTVKGTTVILDFGWFASDRLSGTFQSLDDGRVEFSTVVSLYLFGPEPMTVPVYLIMERL